jgi:Ca2+-binding EF-hand superfamily protein
MSKVDKSKKAHKGLLNWKRGKKDKKSDFQFLQDKTHFSEKELTIIWNQFHKEIPGGVLTKPHFHMLISSVTGIEDKKLVDMMFHAFDSEDLGYITYRQWVLAFSVMTRGTLDEKLHFTFNL